MPKTICSPAGPVRRRRQAGGAGVAAASDGTRIYPYREAMEAFDALPEREFSLADLILLVLGARDEPVRGRALLMREIFLLHEQVLKGRSSDPRFVNYRPAPHSFQVADLLRTLASDGVLERRAPAGPESFRLTPVGKQMAQEAIKRMPAGERRLVSAKRAGWDRLGAGGTLGYVRANYPEYCEKPASRYEDVVWGRGRR